MGDYDHIDPAVAEEIRAMAAQPLPLAELIARWNREIPEDEMAENIALIEWFCRRYPTPQERLAYARRAHRRWMRATPTGRAASSVT